jgi:hypothetical protein
MGRIMCTDKPSLSLSLSLSLILLNKRGFDVLSLQYTVNKTRKCPIPRNDPVHVQKIRKQANKQTNKQTSKREINSINMQ